MPGFLDLRIVDYLFGSAFFGNYTVSHKNDLVGNISCKLNFVSYNNHCAVGGFKTADNIKHLTREFRIKCGGRLVEAENIGIECKRSCNCNTLLLTAAEVTRI